MTRINTVTTEIDALVAQRASMGPRLMTRINVVDALNVAQDDELQWGRV